jgi:hypothetical protein
MTEQVLALSLADELERYGTLNNPNECADELRRLHEANEALREALEFVAKYEELGIMTEAVIRQALARAGETT